MSNSCCLFRYLKWVLDLATRDIQTQFFLALALDNLPALQLIGDKPQKSTLPRMFIVHQIE